MAWVRLDDSAYRHPKLRAAWDDVPAALGLHLLALSYCGDQLTDGNVEDPFVALLFRHARARDRAVQALLRARLWEQADRGYRIHDFLDLNPSREQVLTDRLAAREKKRAQRAGGGGSRGRARSPSPGQLSLGDSGVGKGLLKAVRGNGHEIDAPARAASGTLARYAAELSARREAAS